MVLEQGWAQNEILSQLIKGPMSKNFLFSLNNKLETSIRNPDTSWLRGRRLPSDLWGSLKCSKFYSLRCSWDQRQVEEIVALIFVIYLIFKWSPYKGENMFWSFSPTGKKGARVGQVAVLEQDMWQFLSRAHGSQSQTPSRKLILARLGVEPVTSDPTSQNLTNKPMLCFIN